MSLITCPSCGKKVSKNASYCPQCHTETSKKNDVKQFKTKPCRVCGVDLDVGRYRYVVETNRGLTWVDGTSRDDISRVVRHEPCPNCGEPQPHAKFKDSIAGSLVMVGAMLAIIGCFFVFKTYIYNHFYLFGIGFAVAMLIAYLLEHEKVDKYVSNKWNDRS